MSEQIQSIILDELRSLRTRFDVYSSEMGDRTARLETHMDTLVGNRQPGRLKILEDKVSAIQQWRHYTTGIYIGVSGIVSAATAFIYHLWK
jgi:hypothetical protein